MGLTRKIDLGGKAALKNPFVDPSAKEIARVVMVTFE